MIEQLQEILCTGCKSVEKDVKELRFGCVVIDKDNLPRTVLKKYHSENIVLMEDSVIKPYITRIWDEDMRRYKIIWNPLSLKHLMMYCNKIWIALWIDWKVINSIVHDDYWVNFIDVTEEYNPSKELYEQEDKVLLDIINFFKGQLWNQ